MNSVSLKIIITPTDWEAQPQYCSVIVKVTGQSSARAAHTSRRRRRPTWGLVQRLVFRVSSPTPSEVLGVGPSHLYVTCLPGDADVHSGLGPTELG